MTQLTDITDIPTGMTPDSRTGFFSPHVGDQTYGFVYAKQALCHWAISPVLDPAF
jgi:hypothetical protein